MEGSIVSIESYLLYQFGSTKLMFIQVKPCAPDPALPALAKQGEVSKQKEVVRQREEAKQKEEAKKREEAKQGKKEVARLERLLQEKKQDLERVEAQVSSSSSTGGMGLVSGLRARRRAPLPPGLGARAGPGVKGAGSRDGPKGAGSRDGPKGAGSRDSPKGADSREGAKGDGARGTVKGETRVQKKGKNGKLEDKLEGKQEDKFQEKSRERIKTREKDGKSSKKERLKVAYDWGDDEGSSVQKSETRASIRSVSSSRSRKGGKRSPRKEMEAEHCKKARMEPKCDSKIDETGDKLAKRDNEVFCDKPAGITSAVNTSNGVNTSEEDIYRIDEDELEALKNLKTKFKDEGSQFKKKNGGESHGKSKASSTELSPVRLGSPGSSPGDLIKTCS